MILNGIRNLHCLNPRDWAIGTIGFLRFVNSATFPGGISDEVCCEAFQLLTCFYVALIVRFILRNGELSQIVSHPTLAGEVVSTCRRLWPHLKAHRAVLLDSWPGNALTLDLFLSEMERRE
jgi:hypothetical protein